MNAVDLSSIAILVDPARDNVAVAKQLIPAGTRVHAPGGQTLVVRAEIAPGHRFALQEVPEGKWLIQYGQPFALSRGLGVGDPVNAETTRSVVPHVSAEEIEVTPPVLPPWEGPLPTFQGYVRPDGRAGTRNWVLIVPTSNCSSHEASTIAMQAELSGLYSREKFPNVDGVTAIPHTRGCGCPDMLPLGAQGRKGTGIVEATMRMLADYIQHPNVGAALLIELGCEKTNLTAFNRFIARDLDLPEQRPSPSGAQVRMVRPVDLTTVYGKPVYSISIQSCGGTRATVQRGLEIVAELLEKVNATPRTTVPASKLVLGLKCGGSDAFSGLSANPALGHASDLLIRAGGTSIITEIPEFFGAEHLFAQRAVSREAAHAIFDQMQRYREYAARNGAQMDENPSPGNKEGGLLNITIKSLGAIAKAGTAPVQGVLDYAEPYWKHGQNGLYLMYGPGYDIESVPALVAGGCQVVCFTTGRGSTLGNALGSVIKIATNSTMYERMSDDMDINAGAVLDGGASLPEMGRRIFEKVLAVASGEWTRPEVNGHREFTIWSEEGISL